MVYVDALQTSGTNTHCHCFADDSRELREMGRRLRVPVKVGTKDRKLHLDLNEHQRRLAIEKGAVELCS